ncbi:MAG TPA: protein-L-isoaspartate(D-aspartate) O-methyltransferase [Rhizomicrobium sp.]|nr:protein-L-isoaspartate(D-aspartate) O-methyltransferase [Rhizomicrobium sp.]
MAFDQARKEMVAVQLAGRGVRDARVLEAMAEIPREAFVDPGTEELAYEDRPLPIGESQTISQPLIVAAMAEAARLGPEDRVLEVGAGSGYAASVFSRLAGEVFAIERHASLTEAARKRCRALGYHNILLKTGDGSLGWPEKAPFDAILVAAGVPTAPQSLRLQLKIGGRLIVPLGGADEQRLVRITRAGQDVFDEDDLGGVRFVPLIGAQGWPE